MARRVSPRLTSVIDDHTVVSVGPYIFHKRVPVASSLSASAMVQASPPQSILNPGGGLNPASNSLRK